MGRSRRVKRADATSPCGLVVGHTKDGERDYLLIGPKAKNLALISCGRRYCNVDTPIPNTFKYRTHVRKRKDVVRIMVWLQRRCSRHRLAGWKEGRYSKACKVPCDDAKEAVNRILKSEPARAPCPGCVVGRKR